MPTVTYSVTPAFYTNFTFTSNGNKTFTVFQHFHSDFFCECVAERDRRGKEENAIIN